VVEFILNCSIVGGSMFQSERNNDQSPNSRWNSLELVKGTYGSEDCSNDVAEIKFDKPVTIKVPAVFIALFCIPICTISIPLIP